MKKVIFLWVLILASSSWAKDDIFSFYFHKDAIGALKSVNFFEPVLHGTYELSDSPEYEIRRAAGEYLVVDATGIYIEKNKLLSISKEEIRENSQYNVSNGWLHGVIENDSVPCALEGDKYFFLIPSKTYLAGGSGPTRIVRINRTKYAIFSIEDNGHFSCIIANFSQGGVTMNDILLTKEDPYNIEKIVKREAKEDENGIMTYILSPSVDEWESFIFKSCYEIYDSYSMVKN